MDDENRFSVLLLEKDVLEYNHFKAQYEEFDRLSKTTIKGFLYKNYYKEQKMFWYNKYIKRNLTEDLFNYLKTKNIIKMLLKK